MLYTIGDTTSFVKIQTIYFLLFGVHTIWDAITHFTSCVCGDLSFFFTIIGRDERSTYQTSYFNFLPSEQKPTPIPHGEILTINRLKPVVIPQEYGVKILQQWTEVEPYMEIFLVNLAIKRLIEFISKNVENVSNNEQLEQNKLVEQTKQYTDAKVDHRYVKLTSNVQKQEAHIEQTELNQLIKDAIKNKDQLWDVILGWTSKKEQCAQLSNNTG